MRHAALGSGGRSIGRVDDDGVHRGHAAVRDARMRAQARDGGRSAGLLRARASRAIAPAMSCALRSSRWAVGSSRISSRASSSRRKRARERDPPGLTRGQAPAGALAEQGRHAVWQSLDQRARRPPSRAARHTCASRGAGRAQGGCCPPLFPRTAARAGAPTRSACASARGRAHANPRRRNGSLRRSGSARRASSRATVLLPAPLEPTSAVISPGLSSRSQLAQRIAGALRVLVAHRLQAYRLAGGVGQRASEIARCSIAGRWSSTA